MLVIRLTRIGKKNQPNFRVVLAEKGRPIRGKFIEILGSYNPRLKTKAFKAERIKYWLSKGAQTSPTVHNLLVSEKIIDAAKVKAWRPKKKTQEAKAAGEQPKQTKSESPVKEKSPEAPAVEVPAEQPKTESKAA